MPHIPQRIDRDLSRPLPFLHQKNMFSLSFRKGMRSGTRCCNMATEPAPFTQQIRPFFLKKKKRTVQRNTLYFEKEEGGDGIHNFNLLWAQTSKGGGGKQCHSEGGEGRQHRPRGEKQRSQEEMITGAPPVRTMWESSTNPTGKRASMEAEKGSSAQKDKEKAAPPKKCCVFLFFLRLVFLFLSSLSGGAAVLPSPPLGVVLCPSSFFGCGAAFPYFSTVFFTTVTAFPLLEGAAFSAVLLGGAAEIS